MSATANLLMSEASVWESEMEFESPAAEVLFERPRRNLFPEPHPASASEAIVHFYENDFNAANGLILHLGAGHGELMEVFRQHGFAVMGCEQAGGPTRLARQIHGFDARTLHCSGAENFLNWIRCIGQKAQAIFFRHDWEHNFELHALLPRMADVLGNGGQVIALLPPPAAGYPREAHVSFLNELALAAVSASTTFEITGVDCDEENHFMAFALKKTDKGSDERCGHHEPNFIARNR